MRRSAALLVLLIGAGVAGWYGYLRTRAPAAAAPVAQALPVTAVAARIAPMVERITSYGNLVPIRSVNILSEVAGQITELLFTDGAQVAAGAPLAVMDSAIARAQIAAARAQAETDLQNLRRVQLLARQGLDSASSLEQAQSRAAASQAELQIDEHKLNHLTVRAPFAGTLGSRHVDAGAYVSGTEPIVRLDDLTSLKIEFRLPSSVTQRATDGMAVEVRVPDAPGLAVRGQLSFIDPVVSTDTRSVLLRAVVPNGDRRLRPGLFVRVTLDLGVHPTAVVVPAEAITRELAATYVYVVTDGIARQRPVGTGLSDGTDVEILSGVAGGEQVVTVGQFRLRDGERVRILPPDAVPPAGDDL